MRETPPPSPSAADPATPAALAASAASQTAGPTAPTSPISPTAAGQLLRHTAMAAGRLAAGKIRTAAAALSSALPAAPAALQAWFERHNGSPAKAVAAAGEVLMQAVRDDDLDMVERVLSTPPGKTAVNELDEERLAAAHYAARQNRATLLKVLLDNGADCLLPGEELITPLHLAARVGAEECLAMMLDHLQTTEVNRTLERSYMFDDNVLDCRDLFDHTPLHYAVIREHLGCIELLLDCGADLNVKDKQGATPLHLVCRLGHSAQVVSLLLDHHANIFASDAEGGTPLHAASFHGNVAIIRQLLHAVSTTRQEKLLQAVDLAGNSALHLAVMGGHSRAADVLLRARANPNAQNKELNTPLHLAAHFDGEAFVALLLRWRAELGICNAVGMTPMHVVALYNRARVLRLLLNAGADADPHDEEGRTPLMLAAGKGHLEAVEILLDAGAKLISEDRMQRHALHYAAAEGNIGVAKTLLAAASAQGEPFLSTMLRATDRHNNTVMHAAALTDEAELITLLAESKCGAELLDARNESRATPLHMAAQRGSITAGRALLQLRPSLLEVENVRRYHPLHLASHGGHAHFVEMLIVEFGAAVEARDGRRWTALAFAASEGHLETVDLLIRHRAPVDATDANRTTPLHLAAAKGHVEVVTTLLDSGAPLEATDVFNQNALSIAVRQGNLDAALAIIKHDRWEQAMSQRDEHGNTPMKLMIRHLPLAALAVLDRCRTKTIASKKLGDRSVLRVTYNWKYIEEDFADRQLKPDVETLPLWLMMKENRAELLAHPTVEALLFYKQKHFGAMSYLLSLGLYVLFLFTLTWVVLHTPVQVGTDAHLTGFASAAQYIALLFSFARLIAEVLQMIFNGWRYFTDAVHAIEWGVFTASAVFLVPFWMHHKQSIAQWSFGAVAIFLAWINLIAFVRRLDVFGIYVLMFVETMATVLKVLSIFVLFIIGFALSFHVLLRDTYYFNDPARSLMKTLVMMTGEYEYDVYFPSGNALYVLPYLMFVVFLITMPIVLMNLLIGLAVGDIQRILDNARLNRRKMRVQELLPLQQFLVWAKSAVPPSLVPFLVPGGTNQESFYKTRYVVHTNATSWWGRLVGMMVDVRDDSADSHIAVDEELNEVDKLRQTNAQLAEDLKRMTRQVAELDKIFEEQAALINVLLGEGRAAARGLDLS